MYVLDSVLYAQQQICTCSVTKQRGEIVKNTFGEHTALQSRLQTGVDQSLHLGFSNDLSHNTFSDPRFEYISSSPAVCQVNHILLGSIIQKYYVKCTKY
jgi:hypothetical protein